MKLVALLLAALLVATFLTMTTAKSMTSEQQEELKQKVEEKKKIKVTNIGEKLTKKERKALEKEERKLKDSHDETIEDHGKDSKEYIASLHRLGRNIYQQGKFSAALEISMEIVDFHEKRDGVASNEAANALANVGAAANRVKDMKLCKIMMERSLYILIENYGLQTKETAMQRARLLTFGLPNADSTPGYTYEEYVEEKALYYEEKRTEEEQQGDEL